VLLCPLHGVVYPAGAPYGLITGRVDAWTLASRSTHSSTSRLAVRLPLQLRYCDRAVCHEALHPSPEVRCWSAGTLGRGRGRGRRGSAARRAFAAGRFSWQSHSGVHVADCSLRLNLRCPSASPRLSWNCSRSPGTCLRSPGMCLRTGQPGGMPLRLPGTLVSGISLPLPPLFVVCVTMNPV